ncbi:MAG: hypothetical protein ACXVCO_08525, partial [Ktedonobacterales bacterium]
EARAMTIRSRLFSMPSDTAGSMEQVGWQPQMIRIHLWPQDAYESKGFKDMYMAGSILDRRED